jgi:small subunit ribosomal protein S1
MADQIPASAEVNAASIGLSVRRKVEDTEYNESQFKELQALYEKTLGKISEGEIVRGRIVHIGENDVSVDIGFKSEGTVAIDEFTNKDVLKVGEEIEVFLESVEN